MSNLKTVIEKSNELAEQQTKVLDEVFTSTLNLSGSKDTAKAIMMQIVADESKQIETMEPGPFKTLCCVGLAGILRYIAEK